MSRIPDERLEFQATRSEGRRILLRTNRWVNHIIVLHPELFGHRDDVRGTIEYPDEIHKERLRDRIDLVYWRTAEVWSPPNKLLKVVVRVADEDQLSGEVVTAYPVRIIEVRGVSIWTKS